ncbi:Hsp20/alpha crystallin family protein [Alicyclobacillus cycloheptanicus]|uniref:HSP20 family molecular chaperone IbpA n=1 Tax=Alicyclobacillus cycloheptanicus TaxID=1457 RepID=A0ABT9XF09_9BACL|nr:Hsp20/alpha crystallin family protein [Alicyclobacillus cycloheptanicus]MDQ0188403.1 HSP20 family molecular chaperone IbpA [Alicyclobacillus cycloheptanicus]WDM01108.1 Hsp20/alpha crystallin family protein [Alicyclobacillus cycloheptanicus]
MNNGFFDSFPYLQQMGEQFQKMFGDDFVRNLMNQMQVPAWGQPGNAAGGERFWPGFGPGAGPTGNAGQGGDGAAGSAAGKGTGNGTPGMGEGPPMWNPFMGMNRPSVDPPASYPPADIYETRHEVVVVLELPGMERSSDVRLSVFPEHIVVKGERERRYPNGSSAKLTTAERRVGSFERQIALPARVRKQHAKAVYRAGLLEVRLLKEGKPADGEGNLIDVDFL